MMKPTIQAKVIVVGEQGVGKTSLVVRFVKNEFDEECVSTIGAAYFAKQIAFDHHYVNLHIWDTAGQERFKSMIPMYYRNSSAAILVFDITQSQSFSAVKVWAKELHTNTNEKLVLYLVGSKSDMAEERVVTEDEGRTYARSLSAHYWEISSLKNEGIKDMFQELSGNIIQHHLEKVNRLSNSMHEATSRKNVEIIEEKPSMKMYNESCC